MSVVVVVGELVVRNARWGKVEESHDSGLAGQDVLKHEIDA